MSAPHAAPSVQDSDPPPGRPVEVVQRSGPPPDCDPQEVRTEHFCLRRRWHSIEITHWLQPEELDNNLAGLLAEELFAPGWLSGAEVFEHVFTKIVLSVAEAPARAWAAFYDNTLARIKQCWEQPEVDAGHSSIAGFAPVYRRALDLVPPGCVLDLGSCFGFLPMLLAERGRNAVIASDLVPGSMQLLATMAAARGLELRTLVCDAAQVPLLDQAVRTVTAIHLLEHLDVEHGDAVLAEALRLARERVVVAVPFEDEPTAAYGHVRTFTRNDLVEMGRASGFPFEVDEHHGGWLVVHTRDRETSEPPRARRSGTSEQVRARS
ncbi:mycofactocin oligosaccharide methyltransferase MftM [Saccharopolyspora rectivirgula]|uniref:mycofactocin oligosaccharide methyltransferase MftM n=1 Tax=Saccharopolyspora rectivirgula TaxID=28042 RepID=UPI0009DDBA96|nr:mycofactocin oligosaccharide methyltransferase MftM [Saccharopolyspora rectivirgula]